MAAERRAWPDALLTGGFAALYLVNLAHHALWRDEILAWAIAATSRTPLDLLASQRYDGHPALWHTLLWLAGQAVPDAAAIKLVHGAIGLAVIGLVGLAGPFSRLERALLLGGYFLVFEYTVISRNYGIGVLLALLYARRRVARPEAIAGNAALLALLANTNVFAALLSGALALEYLADRLARPDWRRLAAGAVLYAGGVALAVATVWPAPDLSREVTQPLAHAGDPAHLLRTLLRFLDNALVPIADPAGDFVLLARDGVPLAGLWPQALAGVALLAALGWIFRRWPAGLLVIGLTLLAATVFGHLVYAIAPRHWGVVWLAVVTCLWMLRARAPAARPSLPALALLALGAAGGVQAVKLQWERPFSMTQATAAWIAGSEFAGLPLVGTPDNTAGMVAVLLGREITMPECRCTARRPVFSAARDGFRREMLPGALAALAPAEALLILGWKLSADELAASAGAGLRLTEVKSFTGAHIRNETYHLYRLERRG